VLSNHQQDHKLLAFLAPALPAAPAAPDVVWRQIDLPCASTASTGTWRQNLCLAPAQLPGTSTITWHQRDYLAPARLSGTSMITWHQHKYLVPVQFSHVHKQKQKIRFYFFQLQ
jgi:hypothetical protein